MFYQVNPSVWSTVFLVPTQIVDQHIRVASAEQLKVLLWVLRHAQEPFEIARLCADLKMNESDVHDYMQYWVLMGVLQQPDAPAAVSPAAPAASVQAPPAPAAAEKELPDLAPPKPTSEQIVRRAEESPEIAFLFREAQQSLGRTIGYDGQCSLLQMHDVYGLPVEVILMLLEYTASIGKGNMQYILAIAKDWGTREIDTLEKADEQITTLRKNNRVWKEFAALADIRTPRPTAKQSEYLAQWTAWGFSVEMLYLAYEIMADAIQKVSFAYMHKILTGWQQEGLFTPQAVREARAQKQQAASKKGKASGASYDLDKFRAKSIDVPSSYQKKAKN